MIRPLMLIISGLPCTGKTTIGRKISESFKLPMISKDEIKESLFDSLGWDDREWSKKLGMATYPILYSFCEEQLKNGKSFIVESNFNPKFDNERLSQLRDTYKARLVVVHCECEGSSLFDRFKKRSESGERHPGHRDHLNYNEFRDVMLSGILEVLDVGEKIFRLDTTNLDKVNLAELQEYLEKEL